MNLFFEPSPLPLSLLLLWLTLPGIWLGAKALCAALPADRAVQRMLQPAAALAGWIAIVQIASMLAHSFWIGLPIGMVALSVAGGALWWWRHRAASSASGGAKPIAEASYSGWMWIGMVLITLPIAVASFRGHFADVLLANGHMSMVAQIQNDFFPPRYLGFTNVPLRYHYGFDLVAAGLTALTRIRTDWAIDLLTVFGWAYSWCLLWLLGERLVGRLAGGPWTAVATMLGGGAVVFFAPFVKSGRRWVDVLQGTYSLSVGTEVNPPMASNVFQHPFSLGFPLAIAALLAAAASEPSREAVPAGPSPAHSFWALHWLWGLILAALAITQSVLFVTFLPTIAFIEIVVARRWRFIGTVAAVLVAAWIMGGTLFTHFSGELPLGFHGQFWLTSGPPKIAPAADGAGHEPQEQPSPRFWPIRVAAWHLATFGALLPLGIWGLWHVRRLRVALLLLAGGSLLVPLCVTYEYTWDIVKFSTVAALALGILSGGILAWLAEGVSLGRKALSVICLVAVTASPIMYLGTLLWIQFVSHEKKQFIDGPVALGDDDRQAVAWLRTRARPNELVYRRPEIALGYAQLGGLPSTPEKMNHPDQFGVSNDREAARKAFIKALDPDHPGPLPDFDAFRRLGITRFVVGPDDPWMDEQVKQWAGEGKVHQETKFGTIQIYAVVPDATKS